MDETNEIEAIEMPGTTDPELRRMLGLFDVPAYVRRGQDLEFHIGRLLDRCRGARDEMLTMVRLRLRQWASACAGPGDWSDVFAGPLDALWDLAGAEPPSWGPVTLPPRRRRAVGRDLLASVERFNARWLRFVAELDLSFCNGLISGYNRYYVLEKECSLGSWRLASAHFRPRPPITPETILADLPALPAPALVIV